MPVKVKQFPRARVELHLYCGGTVRKVTGEGLEQLLKNLIKKGPKETWEELREQIYHGLRKSRLVILREGTDWFKLKPAAFKGYPRVRGVWKPTGEFRLVKKSVVDKLRDVCSSDRFKKEFKAWWLKRNPGRKWNPRWHLHHVKPLKWGGINEAENIAPVLFEDHYRLTGFWNKLMQTIAGIGAK